MLLNKISALRACILIAFTKKPEKESVYVGNITLEKDGRKFQFDWNEHSGEYIDKTLLLKTRDLDSMVAPNDATLEELKDAVVTGIFLQGDEDSYVEGQSITDIKLCLYDAANNDSRVFLNKKAFKNADLGEYYDIAWEE